MNNLQSLKIENSQNNTKRSRGAAPDPSTTTTRALALLRRATPTSTPHWFSRWNLSDATENPEADYDILLSANIKKQFEQRQPLLTIQHLAQQESQIQTASILTRRNFTLQTTQNASSPR